MLWLCLLRFNEATSKLAGHKETVIHLIIVNPITGSSLVAVRIKHRDGLRLRYLIGAREVTRSRKFVSIVFWRGQTGLRLRMYE